MYFVKWSREEEEETCTNNILNSLKLIWSISCKPHLGPSITRNKKDAIIAIISILFKFERQNLGIPVHIKKKKNSIKKIDHGRGSDQKNKKSFQMKKFQRT